MASMIATGIVFKTVIDDCRCCGNELLCAEGVHLERKWTDDGSERRFVTWSIIGSCDGSCRQVLAERDMRLIRKFKAAAPKKKKR